MNIFFKRKYGLLALIDKFILVKMANPLMYKDELLQTNEFTNK